MEFAWELIALKSRKIAGRNTWRLLFALLLLCLSLASARAEGSTNGTKTSLGTLENYFERNLSCYEPIYFIAGNPTVEFQFSLKYQLFGFTNQANPVVRTVDRLYFGYTQISLWELFIQDPYFYDTSYKPSLFYLNTNYWSWDGGKYYLGLQTGAEHESNGRGGTEERSMYSAYVQPRLTVELPENFQLYFQPRVRELFWVGHNNPDIAQYRGYADLRTALSWQQAPSTNDDVTEKIELSNKFQIGSEGAHPGYWFDLRFNLAFVPVLKRVNPTIMVQYFTGYGQSLIQYNQKSHAFRAGLCLWY